MKNSLFISKILVFVLIMLFPNFAQNKAGTTIGQFLKIEPSARAISMGNAGVSLSGEATLSFFNPAGLGRLSGSQVQFTHNQWIADITYNYAIAAINFTELGTFSIMMTNLSSGEIAVRTVEQPLGTGEKYSVTNFAFGLGYGLMLTDRVSVGMQLTYMNESIWHSSLNAFGVNFGVQYRLTEGGVMIGASVSNFGTKGKYDGRDLYLNHDLDPKKYGDNDQLPAEFRVDEFSLPVIFRAGISYPYVFSNDFKFLLSIDALHPNDNSESINVGGEVNLVKNFFLRAGYRNLFLANSEGGAVFGGGFNYEFNSSMSIKFDYAYADYGRLAQAHRLTLGINFY